ncbi:MAG TPA: ABC transporter substrate-binding protein [Polyangiaceae bacterium]|nr:ABC transporter substrate-binding protein [Polyangiaceae bacterium]
MKAALAPVLLLLGTLSLGASVIRTARDPGSAAGRRTATVVSPGPFPKTLRRGAHRTTLAAPPSRIVSLTVTTDEMLTDLVVPSRIAAVSRFAGDPSISMAASRVPPTTARVIGLDPEHLIAQGPDLVFVAHYTQEAALRILGAAEIPVVRLRPVRSFEDVFENLRVVGAAVGEDARAEELVGSVRSRLQAVERRVAPLARPRVLYVSVGGYTTGSRTLLDEKIRRAGATNAAADAGLEGDVSASLDLLVALDPDVILVPRWTADAAPALSELASSPAWRDSRAVKQRRVHVLSAAVLTSESQDAAVGVEILAALLHPDGGAT